MVKLVLLFAVVCGATGDVLAKERTRGKRPSPKASPTAADALEQRVRRLEAARPAATASGRYQLETVGDRLVVLDTETGVTQVVNLAATPAYQSVDVGHAWVVVTVLGNVSHRDDPAKASPTGKPR